MPWDAPLSPDPLVQERPEVAGNPWRLLVVCVLCNLTQGKLAWPVALRVFDRWPDELALAKAPVNELAEMLRPIGLYAKRARWLVAMSRAYAAGGWTDPSELPGVGRYARDAWAIFVEARTDIEPRDGHLNRYVAWRIASGTWGRWGGGQPR
jgi:methyl-CpG-binding domain protein 4